MYTAICTTRNCNLKHMPVEEASYSKLWIKRKVCFKKVQYRSSHFRFNSRICHRSHIESSTCSTINQWWPTSATVAKFLVFIVRNESVYGNLTRTLCSKLHNFLCDYVNWWRWRVESLRRAVVFVYRLKSKEEQVPSSILLHPVSLWEGHKSCRLSYTLVLLVNWRHMS